MSRVTLAELVTAPATIGSVPPDSIAPLLGELEAIRAALWARLSTPQSPAREPADVPLQYAYALAKHGELAAVRFGKYVRVRASDLEGWIAEHRDDRAGDPSLARRLHGTAPGEDGRTTALLRKRRARPRRADKSRTAGGSGCVTVAE